MYTTLKGYKTHLSPSQHQKKARCYQTRLLHFKIYQLFNLVWLKVWILSIYLYLSWQMKIWQKIGDPCLPSCSLKYVYGHFMNIRAHSGTTNTFKHCINHQVEACMHLLCDYWRCSCTGITIRCSDVTTGCHKIMHWYICASMPRLTSRLYTVNTNYFYWFLCTEINYFISGHNTVCERAPLR